MGIDANDYKSSKKKSKKNPKCLKSQSLTVETSLPENERISA